MNHSNTIKKINLNLSRLKKNSITEPVIVGYQKSIEVLKNKTDVFNDELVKDVEIVQSRAIISMAVDFVNKEITEKAFLGPLLAHREKYK